MGSFRALVERQRADPIATEFLSVASSAIRLRALRFSPLLPITIAPHHHENVRFRAARHLRYVRFGSKASRPVEATRPFTSAVPPKPDVNSRSWCPTFCATSGHWPIHSITSVARTRNVLGIVRPIVLAVVTLTM